MAASPCLARSGVVTQGQFLVALSKLTDCSWCRYNRFSQHLKNRDLRYVTAKATSNETATKRPAKDEYLLQANVSWPRQASSRTASKMPTDWSFRGGPERIPKSRRHARATRSGPERKVVMRHFLGARSPRTSRAHSDCVHSQYGFESVRAANLGASLGVGGLLMPWHDKVEQRDAAAGWLHVTCSDPAGASPLPRAAQPASAHAKGRVPRRETRPVVRPGGSRRSSCPWRAPA